MQSVTVQEPEKHPWDHLLTKYVHVWLWSILVGATTGIAFSFLSYRSFEKWGILGLGLILILIFGAISILASLYFLFRFLTGYLLPIFFADALVDREQKITAGLRLSHSFKYLIFAAIARFLLSAAETALSSLANIR